MKIQLKGTVLHNGTEYLSGQYLTCSDEDALALIKARVAVKIEVVTVVPSPVINLEKVPSPTITQTTYAPNKLLKSKSKSKTS